jgi:hypothetical protein
VFPACLDQPIPAAITTGPHVTVAVGAAPSPYTAPFLVDYATTGSTIDLASFAPPGPPASGCNPNTLGQRCTFADLDFFGAWGQVTLRTSDASILGTDFLAEGIYAIDYPGRRLLHAANCTDAELLGGGLVPISTAGFFAKDLSRLQPQSVVESGAPAGLQVANVPVVPGGLAGTNALVELDTGFDDAVVPHSINVNVALYDAIVATVPSALTRAASKDLSLTTCAGVAEPVEAYELTGSTFELVDEHGGVGRAWLGATVFVKRTPAAALKCGGIGTWTAPAAQIGTSFLADARLVVFDPFASRVWIGR